MSTSHAPDAGRAARAARRLVALHAAALLAYVAWFLASRDGSMAFRWANDLFYLCTAALPLGASALAWRAPQVDPRARRAWGILLVAGLVAFLPNGAALTASFLARPLEMPWLDVLWAGYYVLVAGALVLLPSAPQTSSGRRTLAIDALIVAVAGGALTVATTVQPVLHAGAHGAGRLLPDVVYPVGDLTLFMGLCVLFARRARAADRRAIVALAVGVLATFVADILHAHERLNHLPTLGSLADPLWGVAELAWTVAAALQLLDAGRPDEAQPPGRGTSMRVALFPHAALAVLLAVMVNDAVYDQVSPWIAGGIALGVLLLQWRQLLALRENATLEAARQTQEARFRALVQHAADLVMIVRPDGMVRYLSPSALRVLGVEDGTPASLTVQGFVHPDDRRPLAALLATIAERGAGDGVGASFRCRDRQGGWRQLECVLTNLMAEPAVGGLVINGRDVSEREALERQLAHAQKTEAIGRLAGGIAHDFNNLLAVVSANAELLRDTVAGQDGAEELHEIHAAARRGADLTRRLLSFSRRQQITHAGAIALDSVVRDAEAMIRRLVAKDVSVAVHMDAASVGVRVDPTQLEQVLMNLAVNARDAMGDGGTLTIATRAVSLDALAARRIAGAMPGEYAEIVVRDTGTGMDEATRARLFEPFFTTKPTGEGTGLGLYIVYGIVAQAAGHIVVDSAPGAGTTFRILLPRHDVAAQPTAALPAAAPRGSESILVVDDEEAIRSALQRYLQRHGYAVTTASDGADALARIEADGPFDLVLTDVVMPGVDGRALVERVRQRWPGQRLMCMSGYTEDATVRELVAPELFVAKPFALDVMGHRIRGALDAGLVADAVTAA